MLYKGCINFNNSNIVKSYSNLTVFYLNIFQNGIYSCESKAEFSAPLLQSSVSRDPSEIILLCWFCAQETFIIIKVENSCADLIFYGHTVQKNSIYLK